MNLVGQVLAGRYEIVEEIGIGGMAVVYKTKCRVLNRYVAIKLLREDLKNDADFVRRFNIEAQAAASLTHHNIVSVFDVGTDNGLHYIVMEYVEGQTLKEYIDEKHELPWREAVDIAMQICKGLEVAHKNSIVHRDIKPHNIMRTAEGVIKVTDFGIARANVQETMTAEDSAIGSVHYISPEQARGGFVDHRSDIYSLGIVLYEMLTGRVPFDNESPVTIAIKHIQEKPVPPCEYNISIPMPLEEAVLKAISKEPSQRYINAVEFFNALSDILNDPHRKYNVVEDSKIDETRVYKTVDVPIDDTVIIQNVNDKDEVLDGVDMKEKVVSNKSKNIDRNKEKNVIILALISSVVVIFGLLFAMASLMGLTDIFFAGRGKVEVPELTGITYEEALDTYSESGFNIVIGKEVKSEQEEGVILYQNPKAKSKIKKSDGMIITVDISLGDEEIVLKDYLRYTDQRDVEIEIEKLGLKFEFIEEASEDIPKGAIIRQVPRAGISVKKGETITFYVSTGPSFNSEDIDTGDNDQTNNNDNQDGKKPDNSKVENSSPPPAKKSTMLTVYGPKDKDSALVQVKANGNIVHSMTIKRGYSEVVKLESTASSVEVEILYDGVSKQKSTVRLY